MFSMVAAIDRNRGIGKNGDLPWKLKGDMNFFRELTVCPDSGLVETRYQMDLGFPEKRALPWEKLVDQIGMRKDLPKPTPDKMNAVFMGRRTWESLPPRFRPLSNRINVVLSHSVDFPVPPEVIKVSSLEEGLTALEQRGREGNPIANTYIIGGAALYNLALRHPRCRRLYLTEIDDAFTCDTYFPDFKNLFYESCSSPTVVENGLSYRFKLYKRDS